ncbi:hypothetical protein JW887_02130 [Candidatus Dojkabacteria bacterium]|nr:hypothetical protein [Candidatus Dojkabacteria bacterium]
MSHVPTDVTKDFLKQVDTISSSKQYEYFDPAQEMSMDDAAEQIYLSKTEKDLVNTPTGNLSVYLRTRKLGDAWDLDLDKKEEIHTARAREVITAVLKVESIIRDPKYTKTLSLPDSLRETINQITEYERLASTTNLQTEEFKSIKTEYIRSRLILLMSLTYPMTQMVDEKKVPKDFLKKANRISHNKFTRTFSTAIVIAGLILGGCRAPGPGISAEKVANEPVIEQIDRVNYTDQNDLPIPQQQSVVTPVKEDDSTTRLNINKEQEYGREDTRPIYENDDIATPDDVTTTTELQPVQVEQESSPTAAIEISPMSWEAFNKLNLNEAQQLIEELIHRPGGLELGPDAILEYVRVTDQSVVYTSSAEGIFITGSMNPNSSSITNLVPAENNTTDIYISPTNTVNIREGTLGGNTYTIRIRLGRYDSSGSIVLPTSDSQIARFDPQLLGTFTLSRFLAAGSEESYSQWWRALKKTVIGAMNINQYFDTQTLSSGQEFNFGQTFMTGSGQPSNTECEGAQSFYRAYMASAYKAYVLGQPSPLVPIQRSMHPYIELLYPSAYTINVFEVDQNSGNVSAEKFSGTPNSIAEANNFHQGLYDYLATHPNTFADPGLFFAEWDRYYHDDVTFGENHPFVIRSLRDGIVIKAYITVIADGVPITTREQMNRDYRNILYRVTYVIKDTNQK